MSCFHLLNPRDDTGHASSSTTWFSLCTQQNLQSASKIKPSIKIYISEALRCLQSSSRFFDGRYMQGYSLKSTEKLKKTGSSIVSSAAASFFSTIYLRNGIFQSIQTSLNFILISSWQQFCRLIADSYLKIWYKTVLKTLETIASTAQVTIKHRTSCFV